jgi:hypothetical protein
MQLRHIMKKERRDEEEEEKSFNVYRIVLKYIDK